MKRICTILLICGLFVGQAWAGYWATFPVTTSEGGKVYNEEGMQWYEGEPPLTSQERAEIRALLERCRELVKPGAVIVIPNEFGMPYAIASDYGVDKLRRDIDEFLKRLTSE